MNDWMINAALLVFSILTFVIGLCVGQRSAYKHMEELEREQQQQQVWHNFIRSMKGGHHEQ